VEFQAFLNRLLDKRHSGLTPALLNPQHEKQRSGNMWLLVENAKLQQWRKIHEEKNT
jgi:hypothetical protein